ncbi:MAG: hypothetical protein ABII21_02735 [bacterium]
MPESTSIEAIQLTRKIFETIHGNLGLLKFNIEELTPTNGSPTTESKKWDVVCSFYETLGSSSPTKYKASVDLVTNTISIKKISGTDERQGDLEGQWTVKKKDKTGQ